MIFVNFNKKKLKLTFFALTSWKKLSSEKFLFIKDQTQIFYLEHINFKIYNFCGVNISSLILR